MVYRTLRTAKSTLVVSSSFRQKKAANASDGPLERVTLSDVLVTEMLSLNESAIDLGKQSVCL